MTTAEILVLVLPIAAIQIGMAVLAVRDLIRPERRVRGESKLMWGLIVLLVGFVGPLLYFTIGRDDT